MKILLKRRNVFVFFILVIISAIFYMSYNLNQIVSEDLNAGQLKDQVKLLKSQIDQLEKKASDNERNLRNLQKIYNHKGDLNAKSDNDNRIGGLRRRNLSDMMPPHDRLILPKFPDLNLFDRFRIDNMLDSNADVFNNKHVSVSSSEVKVYHKQCEWFAEQKPTTADIEISDLMSKLPFDDIDGGVWKQGFEITYDEKQWNPQKKLHVFVIPHSHNDPGWIMTFEEYFSARTRGILDAIVNSLSENKSRKFIWAETSYLSLWWNQASDEMKAKMKRLIIETKQLEIVTGGWVMTDEANSHYYATIEQMVEGHEWLKANIDPAIRPAYGWSIDPFGYTPTMAYLLKQMGFNAMLIQRVHYHVKKYMAQTLRFEFNWKQSFSTENSKDNSIFCHVMPFYSYDIPHTCGPDPKICCQFDFKRMSGEINCPWGIRPQKITQSNVRERAKTLLDQYRKKSQLYGDRDNHNVLLVPLGDDFRYRDLQEAHDQFENYERLMEYINNQPEWNAEVKFGTLSDYFEFLFKHNSEIKKKVETFSGDFFTYADRQDHYWSGYYTSRPFNKRLDRLVEYYLRSAEVIYSYANLFSSKNANKFTRADGLYKKLLVARRNLGLFQHHDGITGTSKTPVVLDYANKLFQSLENTKEIIEASISYLMSNENKDESIFSIEDVRLAGNDQDKQSKVKPIIRLDSEKEEKKILLYNSNLNERHEIVSLRVSHSNVEVIDSKGLFVQNVQVSLVWANMEGVLPYDKTSDRLDSNNNLRFSTQFDSNSFELLFEVVLPPLSLSTFTIRRKSQADAFTSSYNNVTFYSDSSNSDLVEATKKAINEKLKSTGYSLEVDFKKTESSASSENMIEIGSENIKLLFSPQTGLLNKIVTEAKELKAKIKFLKYGTTSANEKSGAYLFLPDGSGQELKANKFLQWIRVEHSGKLRNRVCVNMTVLMHCVDVFPSIDKAKNLKYPLMHVWNMVDLRRSHNFELALHMETDIKNDDYVHTDLNGFQYIKRKNYKKLTLQGNVYPMPSGAFIQDSTKRLNILTAQPLGVASLDPSSIQVFLDRRLDQDDNRGMEQAMNDNVLVSSKFFIFFESINGMTSSTDKSESLASNYPSLMSQLLSFDLINQVTKLYLTNEQAKIKNDLVLSNKNKKYPCDLRLVNMRTMQTKDERPLANEVGLILHRIVFEDCPSSPYAQLSSYYINQCNSDNQFSFEDFFEFFSRNDKLALKINNITNTYLTLQKRSDLSAAAGSLQVKQKTDNILDHLQPMQIEAYRINFN